MKLQKEAGETRRITHALSIRQPWAELIMRGIKVAELRSVPTKIRERVYIYASQRPEPDREYIAFGDHREALPTGVLVGTVEILRCEQLGDRDFAYVLANPRRLSRPLKPHNHPHPVWFRPF